jgi:Zn-dependent alcohol dehydrogenase
MRLSADRLPLDKIVTHKYKVSDVQKAIDNLKNRQGIKHALIG